METKGSDPANPCTDVKKELNGPTHIKNYGGLTKREYFAATAMQGITSSPLLRTTSISQHCKDAVSYADLLIKELNKQENEEK